jgi:MshEN domain
VKLGESLVREGLITKQQLALALERQVLFGGRIGTNLLELKILDEDDFTRFLSKYFDTPAVTKEVLSAIPRDVLYCISRELVEKYKIFPVKKEHKRLHTAMLNPRDIQEIDELRFITGFDIIPLVIAEIRLLYVLEKHYGIKYDVRYSRFFSRISPEFMTADSIDQIKVALARVNNVEELGNIVIQAASSVAARVVLFHVQNGKIIPWKAKSITIEGFAAGEGDVPIVSEVVKGKKHYRGPLTDEPANRPLVRLLGGTPQDVLVLPISSGEKTTAILLIDNGQKGTLDANVILLSRLASMASCALEILLLRKRMSEI